MDADDQRAAEGGEAARDAAQAFVAGLIARGEAARADEHGTLPAGATHELVEDADGRLTARRRRFSA